MTADQIARVRSTWSIAMSAGDGLARAFYLRLFEQSPTAEAMFAKADPAQQARKLEQTLDAIVLNLHDMPALTPDIEAMGLRHSGYGVNDGHYLLVGELLIETIEQFVGPEFNRDDREAWRAAYAAVAEVMIGGASGGSTHVPSTGR
ncbi:MAG TPA: globin domain-containing protein [Gemmatimonadaceae bacterium]|nr:globin domain-containing protein [Gemmatimonadaceae bacterium]